jgi:hypothetical protein
MRQADRPMPHADQDPKHQLSLELAATKPLPRHLKARLKQYGAFFATLRLLPNRWYLKKLGGYFPPSPCVLVDLLHSNT